MTTTTPQTLLITAKVVSPNGQTNTASVSHSDQFDPNTGNNSASATETPQQADLSITKTGPRTANIGVPFNYTITLSNAGPDPATNVTVLDALPAGLSFVSASPTQGTYNSGSGTWTVGTVAVSGSATLTLTVQKTNNNTITNTVQISHSDQFDPNTGNNSASATTAGSSAAPPPFP